MHSNHHVDQVHAFHSHLVVDLQLAPCFLKLLGFLQPPHLSSAWHAFCSKTPAVSCASTKSLVVSIRVGINWISAKSPGIPEQFKTISISRFVDTPDGFGGFASSQT